MSWDKALSRIAPYAAVVTAIAVTMLVFASSFQR